MEKRGGTGACLMELLSLHLYHGPAHLVLYVILELQSLQTRF